VRNLKEAIPRFEHAYGVTFAEPVVAKARLTQRGLPEQQIEVPLTYSHQGPPYLELLEMTGDSGIYRTDQPEGLHHLGVWTSNCEERTAELVAQGLEPIATMYRDDGSITVSYFESEVSHGVMLEMVDEARRTAIEDWLAGRGSYVS
jgi:hypothetical protein